MIDVFEISVTGKRLSEPTPSINIPAGNVNTAVLLFNILDDEMKCMTKNVVFINDKFIIKSELLKNNKVYIPPEILQTRGVFSVGLWATTVNGDSEIECRVSTNLVYGIVGEGAYRDSTSESKPIKATQYERYFQEFCYLQNDFEKLKKYFEKNEFISKRIISRDEIDGTEDDMMNGIIPDYIFDGSIVNYRQDGNSKYENAPFDSAIIFTLANYILGNEDAVLGDLTQTQVAITGYSGINNSFIWVRNISNVENHPRNTPWKNIASNPNNDMGNLAGESEIDIEMSDTSENAVQNKVIKAYIDKKLGDVDVALDSILDIQNGLIGGDVV